MKIEYLATEIRNAVGIITLNNPQTLNSVNEKMLSELAWQLKEFDRNNQVKVIILKGIEKSFAAGIDIKELAANIGNAKNIMQNMQQHFSVITHMRKPLIAVVSGFALGIGCEIALNCDIVLASDSARFGLPELSIGLLPCFGGCSSLTRHIGKAKASDMIMTGRALSADEAEQSGIVSRVVNASALEEEALKIAQRIVALPTNTINLAKKIITSVTNEENLSFENLLSLSCIDSNEFKQTLLNFAEKKPARAEKA